ncbi:MaoC family dehydratase [Pseudonocardiaceae bacterium YIM PH 21723]|nr:MaoC family dehydratase [Pseudonocardiaceae bacterium YIM PH 21723]
MPIDPALAAAYHFEPLEVTVERGRLAFFAKAIGQTDPVYFDLAAAEAAGHPDLPVPPTFYFSLELERPNGVAWLDALGIDLRRVLHGEQSFTYYAPAYAGDTLRLTTKVTDVASKKGGAMELVTKKTEVTHDGEPIADLSTLLVVRNPEVTA